MTRTPETLISRLIEIAADKKELEDEEKDLKAQLTHLLPVGKHELENATVTLSLNRKLNEQKFMENYPIAQFPTYYQAKPDTKAIKADIGENEYHRYCTEGQPRITIKA